MDVRLKRILSLLQEVELSLGMLQQLILTECVPELADDKRKRVLDRVANLLDQIKNDELAKLRGAVREVEPSFQDCRIGSLSKKLAERYFHSHSSTDFLNAAVDLLVAETHSERAAIVLCLGRPEEVEVVCARNFQSRDLSADEHALSRTLLNRAISSADALLVKDAQTDPTYSYETSVIRRQVRSALVAPLRIGTQIFGAIYLENSSIASVYSEADGELLKGIGQIIAVYLDATDRLQAAIEAKDAISLEAQAGGIRGEIIGNSPKVQRLLQVISQVACSSATVLIEGESGSGKELAARALHAASPRAQRAFVAVNCAALPETLAESELFGHERGAFTGAFERKIGRFEQADGGTVFLDEVGELPLTVQAKLLRFLQSQEFERLGSVKTIKVDVRVIAATCRQLERMVAEGRFLEALFYRLNVVPIGMPPLRERKEDIPPLANYFLRKFASAAGRFPMRFHPEALLALEAYPFPGNVRELENLVQRLVLLTRANEIQIHDLPESVIGDRHRVIDLEKNPLRHLLRTPPEDNDDLSRRRTAIFGIAQAYVDQLEEELIKRSLEKTEGNVSEAARISGLHRSLFYRKKQIEEE